MKEGNYTVSEDGMTRSDGLKLGKEKLKLDIKKKIFNSYNNWTMWEITEGGGQITNTMGSI